MNNSNANSAEGIVATAAMMKELDDEEPSLLSSGSSVWGSTAIGPADFKNALEAIQKRKQEEEDEKARSLPSPRLSTTADELKKKGSQSVLAMNFTGAELVEQFTTKVSKVEAVTVAQSLLDNGIIERVDTLKRRDTISLSSFGGQQNLSQFNESFIYTPVLLHELSDKIINSLLGLLHHSNAGNYSNSSGNSFMFRESEAQECWVKSACGIVPTKQDASDICQEMVNKGFIEPASNNTALSKALRWSEVRSMYVVRKERYLYWGPLVCPGWKVRWFLCKSASDKKLYCFKNPKQARPRAYLDLGEAYFNVLGKLDFVIETPTKAWKFQALSQDAMEQWNNVVKQSSTYIYATNSAIDILTDRLLIYREASTKKFLQNNSPLIAEDVTLPDLRRHKTHSSEFTVYAPIAPIDYSGTDKVLAEKSLPCVLQTMSWDHATALTLAKGRLWAGTMKGFVYVTPLSYPRRVVEDASRLSALSNKRNSTSSSNASSQHKDRVVVFAATRKVMWSGDASGGIVVWNLESCKPINYIDRKTCRPVVAAADNIRELMYLSGVKEGTVEVMYAAGTPDKIGARRVIALPGCTGDVVKIRVSEDCRTWMAVGPQQDRIVYEANAEKQVIVRCIRVPASITSIVSFMPCEEGELRGLWSSHAGGELCFWDVKNKRVYTRRSVCRGPGWAAENLWVKKGHAITLGKDGDIVEWDASDLSVVRGIMPFSKIHTDRGCIQTIGCDIKSNYVAVTNEDSEIIVYDIKNRF